MRTSIIEIPFCSAKYVPSTVAPTSAITVTQDYDARGYFGHAVVGRRFARAVRAWAAREWAAIQEREERLESAQGCCSDGHVYASGPCPACGFDYCWVCELALLLLAEMGEE